MKKNLLTLVLLFAATLVVRSQSLYGITFGGGKDGGGTINKFDRLTNNPAVQRSFQNPGVNPYYSALTYASNGKLYGMTFNGGAVDAGVIFSFDPATSDYTTLFDFDGENGAQPSGSLIQASDGKLYGMTSFGGDLNSGVIFSFDPSSSTYTKLFNFDNDNGANPCGSLLQMANGKMYGMTAEGGNQNLGTIFSFDPVSLKITKVDDLDNVNGAVPLGSLVKGNDGLLYGMCANGGGNQSGVIFAFNTGNLTFAKLKDFDYASGYYPHGSLLTGTDGKFYGMTYKGGSHNEGVLFSFESSTLTYTKLKDFDGANGGEPLGSLVQAADGKIYGMTSEGGNANLGIIFSFDPSTTNYTIEKAFNDRDGESPFSNMTLANDGKFYGTTFQGGVADAGVIFSFDPSSRVYIKLKDFGTDVMGQRPSGHLISSADGKLYGMTPFGGVHNLGVIYSFDPAVSVYKKLMDFDSSNGANPFGGFIRDSDGKLYAMTSKGGSNNSGVLFSFDPATSTYTRLNDFEKGDGDNPYGSLMQAANGKLYGLTSNDGKYGFGSIFSFDRSSSVFTKLFDFNYKNGGNPYGRVVQAANGKLYGITNQGGNGYVRGYDTTGAGVIFSFDPVTMGYTEIKDFDYYNDGGFSYGSFVKATNGKLYALTNKGGAADYGVMFSLDPLTNTFNKLNDFDGENGADPYGNLMQAIDGKLYGATFDGGINNAGVIFSFDPETSSFNKLTDLDIANGANPYLGSSFVEVPEGGPLPVTLVTFAGKNNGAINKLVWKVDNEENVAYYELQRSSNGQQFAATNQTKATGSNSYVYNDNILFEPLPVYYYRLKIVDKDANFKFSEVLQLRSDLNKNLVTVNPNPFKDRLLITIQSLSPDKVTFILTDVCGRQIVKKNKSIFAGTNVIGINETGNLTRGTYFLTIIKSDQTQTIKVIKGD